MQRVQTSGTCYAQAAIVLQHYLVTKHRRAPVGMIDLSTHLMSVEAQELKEMVLNSESGNSARLLGHILLRGSMISCEGLEFVTA